MIGEGLEAVGGGREAALFLIQRADAELAIGENFLNVAELLLRQRSELAVGELEDQLLAFLLRRSRACLGSRSALSICL